MYNCTCQNLKISENIAFDMVCEGQNRKKPMFTGLVAIFCQSSPPTRKSDIDFRRPLYIVIASRDCLAQRAVAQTSGGSLPNPAMTLCPHHRANVAGNPQLG